MKRQRHSHGRPVPTLTSSNEVPNKFHLSFRHHTGIRLRLKGKPRMPNDQFTLSGPDTDRQSLFLLLLFALVVLGAGLGMRDPWPADEPRFALVAKQMVDSGQWLFPFRGGELYPDKPPVFMWVIALFYRLTGSLRVSFLLPSLLSGVGIIALVHDLARRLWDRQTAFRAGLLLLFTVQFTVQAKTAQIDALVTFFITLGLYGFLRFLLCDGGWRWYYLGWFAAGLGIITKGVGILAALVLVPAIWTHWDGIRKAGRAAWFKALAGPLFMLLAIGLWLAPMLIAVHLSHDPSLIAYRNNILFRQTMTRYADSWHHHQPFWYYLVNVIPVFWMPLSLLLPWLAWRGRDAFRAKDRAVILLGGFLVLVLLFFSLSSGKRSVYITPATPALALLAALWVPDLLARRWPPRLLRGLGWLLSLIFLGLALSLMASPKLSAKAVDLGAHPWLLFLSMGASIALVCLALRRAPLSSVFASLAVIWLHYSLWGYPLLDEVRSAKKLMSQVTARVPERAPLLIVSFREQFLLQAGRPVEHFSYAMKDKEQVAAAAGWLRQSGNRWVLGRAEIMGSRFDNAKGLSLGARHDGTWTLYRAEALSPVDLGGPAAAPPFHYQPRR